jgi:hypothetical protein
MNISCVHRDIPQNLTLAVEESSHPPLPHLDNIVMDQLQVLGTIPRSTRGSTGKEEKKPIKLGKFLCTDRNARLVAVDCPLGRGWTVRKTGADCLQYKRSLQPKNHASV